MNVKELKELLSKFNDSDEVYIEYEDDDENIGITYGSFRMLESDIYSDNRGAVIFKSY